MSRWNWRGSTRGPRPCVMIDSYAPERNGTPRSDPERRLTPRSQSPWMPNVSLGFSLMSSANTHDCHDPRSPSSSGSDPFEDRTSVSWFALGRDIRDDTIRGAGELRLQSGQRWWEPPDAGG